MAIQNTFKRYELKYKLTPAQYELLCAHMEGHMQMDEYGHNKISNIYFDTPDYRIIRESIEKPKYKEKLRVRCYGQPSDDKPAFIELKKKYNGIVYKRRITANQDKALTYLCSEDGFPEETQISREISYFTHSFDAINPAVYLSYEREAFFGLEDSSFRITFDFNIKMRDDHVSFEEYPSDRAVLGDDTVLMEVKTTAGLPLWFLEFLSEHKIYKTSFSKYGTAYSKYIMPKLIDDLKEVANG